MKYKYQEIEIKTPLETSSVIQRSDGAFIPKDPGNSDYQRYLRWLENPDAEENGTIS
jgi:hypothetical protein